VLPFIFCYWSIGPFVLNTQTYLKEFTMSKVIGFIVCAILGGLFMNAKYDTPTGLVAKADVIYGHRTGPDGQTMLLTSK
jgi:hypothetical protein